MRICVPVPCFFGKMDFADAIYKIKELGFDAIETYDWKKLDLDQVRAVCEETGVELLSMCTTEFRMTDPSYRQAWLEGLEDLDLVGIHTVIFRTSEAETELRVADLLEKCEAGDSITLNHSGTATKLERTQEIPLA